MGSNLFDQMNDLLGSEVETDDSLSSQLMYNNMGMDFLDDNQLIPSFSSNADNEYSTTHLDMTALGTNPVPESRERRKSRKQSLEARAVSPLPKHTTSDKEKKCYERDPDDPQLTAAERKRIIKARNSKCFRDDRKTGTEKLKIQVEQLKHKVKNLEEENRDLRSLISGLSIN